jgi:hypothetical protein
MPVEIDTFTTEVTVVDEDGGLSGRRLEMLIEEIVRRVERRRRDEERLHENTSFDRLAHGPG